MYTTKRDTAKYWKELLIGTSLLIFLWLGSVAYGKSDTVTVTDVVNRVSHERNLTVEERSRLAERVSGWVTNNPNLIKTPMVVYHYLGGGNQ